MEIFRICKESYSGKITPSGTANSWNTRGQYVVYAGSSRSLSTLELVVHRSSIVPAENYRVMVISVADDDSLVSQVYLKDLPAGWRTLAAYSALQNIGSNWYNEKKTLVLKVPSVVIPQEYNYVLNTEHPDFSLCIQLVRIEEYFWDKRLF